MQSLSRRNIIFLIALAVLLGALLYSAFGDWGAVLGSPEEPQDLVYSKEIDSDEATRTIFAERAEITKKGIAAYDAVGDVDWNLYLSLGSDANFIGDLATARWAYEELLQLNPISYIAWGAYAGILEDMGDLEAAEEANWQALNLNATSASFQKYIRFLDKYNENGENDDRILEMYELSIQLLGQQPWSMLGLGEFYLERGDCEHAVEHYEVALQLDPENTAIQSDLEDVREECRGQ